VSLVLQTAARTDKGLVRAGNEDYLHLDDSHLVYAVCDGMGGHQAGEVASMTASETIRKAFAHFRQKLLDDPALGFDRTIPPNGELLVKSIRLANRAIYSKALVDSGLSGMGTTIVALAFEADIVSIAHVGDSRAYRLEEKTLVPLTRDHSWVAEIRQQQHLTEEEATSVIGKNVITRALGVREGVEVDCRIVKVKAGDTFVLCSDGLCGFADDDEIFDVAAKYRDNLRNLVDNLIQMANDRGGADNVSVIAIRVESAGESPLPELDVFTAKAEPADTLEAEDRWLEELAEVDAPSGANDSGDKPGGHTSKMLLLGIFAAFAIVAVLIVWMQTH
jgi:serine/threonine protein phosphatase PrpC